MTPLNTHMTKPFKNLKGVAETTTPFLYIVGWPDLHKFYVGVRYTKGCDPSDMWTRYFTSSKYVHSLAAAHGRPPYIDIIQTFDTADEAKDAEFNILRDNEALKKDWFINLRAGNAIRMTPEVRAKVGERSAERWRDPEYRANQIAKRTRIKSQTEIDAEHAAREARRIEANRKRSEALKRQHADPAIRAARTAGLRSPEARRRKMESSRANPQTFSDERRKAVSEKAKARWADPAFKSKMMEHMSNLHLSRKGLDAS